MISWKWQLISIIFIIFRLLNEDLVSEVPVNTSYHDHNRSRRSRRNQGAGSSSGHNRGDDNDERFQEITAQANIEVKTLQSSKVKTVFCAIFISHNLVVLFS